MKIVIMGCGRTGAALANLLDKEGHGVTIMDLSAYQFRRLSPDFRGVSFVGNGIDQDALIRAGIKEADGFVAITQGDNRNIMAAQIAKNIFGVQRVLCRLYDPLRAELYAELGLTVFNPTTLGAGILKDALEKVEV
jgi:trk system potassium uptake protein TrkA